MDFLSLQKLLFHFISTKRQSDLKLAHYLEKNKFLHQLQHPFTFYVFPLVCQYGTVTLPDFVSQYVCVCV